MKLYSPESILSAGTKVEVLLRFTTLQVERVRLPRAEWQSPEYLKKHPLGKVPTLETPEGCIFESHSIMRFIARKVGHFYGESPFETATIDQWLEYINLQVSGALGKILYQVLGYAPGEKQTYEDAKKEIIGVLKIADSHLKTKEFLGGNKISIADISLASNLRYLFRLTFDEKVRSSLPNLTKWIVHVSELKEFTEHFGKLWLCQKQFVPSFDDGKKEQKEKAEKPKQEKPKQEKAAKQQPKPKEEKPKKKKDSDEEEETHVEKKQANPLDSLPKSPFNLDDWKREFCNTPDRVGCLKSFWEKFDEAGWSIWKTHYMRYKDEGRVDYLTGNLKNGFLRNLEHFRKYTFCMLGVYGVEGDYEIEGAWLWRGTEIPMEWKEHQSYESFEFKKLNPKDENDRNLVTSYWLSLTEGDIVEGKPLVEGKWFK